MLRLIGDQKTLEKIEYINGVEIWDLHWIGPISTMIASPFILKVSKLYIEGAEVFAFAVTNLDKVRDFFSKRKARHQREAYHDLFATIENDLVAIKESRDEALNILQTYIISSHKSGASQTTVSSVDLQKINNYLSNLNQYDKNVESELLKRADRLDGLEMMGRKMANISKKFKDVITIKP